MLTNKIAALFIINTTFCGICVKPRLSLKVMLKDMIEGYWAHLHLHIKEIHELII